MDRMYRINNSWTDFDKNLKNLKNILQKNQYPLKMIDHIQADPAFVIRGGPNSEHLLSNFRKLLKKGKFFLTTKSLLVKRN